VIFDVAGATAQVAVERLGDGFLEIRSRYRLLRQTFQQDLTLVQKTWSAIATLERKMLDESFLKNRKFAILRMTFDRADGFAIERNRRNNAGRAGVARPVRIIDDDRAAQALRGAATRSARDTHARNHSWSNHRARLSGRRPDR